MVHWFLRISTFIKILLFCMLLCADTITSLKKFMYFSAIKNGICEGEAFESSENAVSSLDCIRRCEDFSACDVICYNKVTKECKFYNWWTLTVVHAENPDKIWRHSSIPMLNAHRPDNSLMDHASAISLCESLGGRLTTVLEMYAISTDNIYDMCRCGWVGGQQSIRLVVKDKNSCQWALMDGLNVCKGIDVAPYAYCRFEDNDDLI